MPHWKFDETVLRYFLLNQADQLKALGFSLHSIEEACFLDSDGFEQLAEVEEKLIDQYVLGQLSPVDQNLFETGYLTTERRKRKVSLAAELLQRAVPGFQPSTDLPATSFAGDDEEIRRYLLGTMPEADRNRFEALFFEDDELFERVKHVEDQLINDHLLFALSENDQQAFTETYLVPPSRFNRVKMAEMLLAEATQQLSEDPQFCDSIGYLHPLEPSDIGQKGRNNT